MHLPYGAFSAGDGDVRLGVRTDDDRVVDLRLLSARGLVPDPAGTLRAPTLNPFLAEGRQRWSEVRAALVEAVGGGADIEAVPVADVRLHLPFEPADYVDFYSSRHHAENVGRLFRPDSEPLLPNWRHLPVAYHGRAGTLVVSGTGVVRPHGQYPAGGEGPVFGPTARLDVEVEVGFVVGVGSAIGTPVPASAFADHVFGVVLLNDWSARDIQAWEYRPLGPFLGKSFATSVSAWVTPLEALAAARVPGVAQDPAPLPYLRDDDPWALDLRLELAVNGEVVSRPPFATTYWTPGQQLAHMTVNGASLRTGDLYASGTVSGPGAGEVGSLLELWQGRRFLDDGDEVAIRGTAVAGGGATLALGEVVGRVLPACPMSL